MKRNQGFTLVEVVVVIAVVALLSAIIVPMVAKQIDDAKIGRAKNECVVIGSAIGQFYKDVGVFPAAKDSTGRVDHSLYGLVSGTAVVTVGTATTALSYGFTATGNDDWYDGGQTASADLLDVFDNHLNVNTPEGATGAAYATTGEFRWRGPYLAPINKDPWGHYYMCNIRAAYNGTNTQCVVMSAGPNGSIDTAYTAARNGTAATTTEPTSDDIWAVVHLRP